MKANRPSFHVRRFDRTSSVARAQGVGQVTRGHFGFEHQASGIRPQNVLLQMPGHPFNQATR